MPVERGITLGVVSSAVFHPFLEWSLADSACATVQRDRDLGKFRLLQVATRDLLVCAQILEAVPAASLHVGDSARFDVEGAHRAGMRTAWLNSNCSADPPGAQPNLVFTSLVGSARRCMGLLTKPAQ